MGLFKDLSEGKMPEKSDLEGEEVTVDAESKEEEAMSDFEDANVDKDILNQIFGAENEGAGQEAASEDVPAAEEAPDAAEAAEEDSALELVDIADDEEDVSTDMGSDIQVEDNTEKKKLEWESAPMEGIPDSDVTVITKGTTINGGIASDGSLEIMGTITGDVECLGKVSVYGTISGNVSASDVVIKTRRLEGNIKSEGSVEVVQGTIVIGDIVGTSATVAGAINGNIDVNGPVTVDSTAIVKGSIKAKSIQVNTGAVIDGYCSLNYAGVNLEDFFSDN